MVGLQAAQRIFAGFKDVVARVAPLIGAGSHVPMHFCRQNDRIAPAVCLQGSADDILALTGIVYIGRIDEVDAAFQRPVNDRTRVGFGCWPAKIHRAQAQRRNLNACPS